MRRPTAIRLLIASNDSKVRRRLASLSEELPFPTTIVGARNGEEAARSHIKNRFDITLLDSSMPLVECLSAIQAIRLRMPTARIVLLTSSSKGISLKKALRSEVSGFLGQRATLQELSDCVRFVHAGKRYRPPSPGYVESSRNTVLTKRELEVLRLMATDIQNKDIGMALSITEGTVKIHVHNVLSKLGVKSRTGAVARGLRDHLL
jgi:two-component system, NarL family, response regulator